MVQTVAQHLEDIYDAHDVVLFGNCGKIRVFQ